jgi:hypothetical protein
MTPRLPFAPRFMGQRGSVLALALWGAASTATTAHADDARASDPTDAITIEVAEESPPADIYGGPPDDRDNPKPPPENWGFPSGIQGQWNAPDASLSIQADRYTRTHNATVETGRIAVIPEDDGTKPEITVRVKLSERATSDGKTQPDVIEVWVLTSDLKTLKISGQTFTHEEIPAPSVAEYGMPAGEY